MPEQKINNKKKHLLSWIVFLPTLMIVLFTLILGMFPALIILFTDKVRFPVEINIYEPTVWMFHILISNIIIFTTIILYQKNKLPDMLTRLIKYILNFELSNRITIILIVVLIGSYVILTVEELSAEDPWEDYKRTVEKKLLNWSFDYGKVGPTITYFLGYLSMEIFGSYRVFPFIASIVCLFLTYLITVQISKKRFAGIIALIIVLQSENFLTYDTTITYPIFWIMFYLFSIYFIFKTWPLSSCSFIGSVLSKLLALSFLPITFLFIATVDLPKRKKKLLLSSYSAVIVIALVLVFMQIIPIGNYFSFDNTSSLNISDIFGGFSIILSQLRYDTIIVIFLLPLIVCLFLTSKKGISNANALLILIGGIILMTVILPVLTSFTNTPYRLLPLVFFFSIGVGTLLSKNINLQGELLSRKL